MYEMPEEIRQSYEAFNQVFKEYQNLYDDIALQIGVSQSAFDVLWALCEQGEGLLQRDICKYTYIGKQTVNSSVHKLVASGLLRLEHAEVGRGMHVYFTEEGRRFADAHVVPVLEADERAFAESPQEDREAIVRLAGRYLARLKHQLEAVRRGEPLPCVSDEDGAFGEDDTLDEGAAPGGTSAVPAPPVLIACGEGTALVSASAASVVVGAFAGDFGTSGEGGSSDGIPAIAPVVSAAVPVVPAESGISGGTSAVPAPPIPAPSAAPLPLDLQPSACMPGDKE